MTVVSKQTIEFIISQKLNNAQYKTIVKNIKAIWNGDKIVVARQSQKTSLPCIAMTLANVLPKDVEFVGLED